MIARNPRHPRHRRRRSDAAQVPDNITSNNLHLLDKYEAIAITPQIVEMLRAADIMTPDEEDAGLLDEQEDGEVVVTAGALRRLIDRLVEC
jgi:hypothetical protein